MTIDADTVPEQFRYLVPLAEEWGINDDGYRMDKIRAAPPQAIEHLKAAVLPVADQLYLAWLGDGAALQTKANDAYVAFTALVLAAEEA